MNLADIKKSDIPKRRLYQIERVIVREATSLWCREQSFYCDNFASDAEVDISTRRITVSFSNTFRMQHGLLESTVNDMMRGLILTIAADEKGHLLPDYAVIVKNILDVFFHRLLEIADKKFIYQRLQSLELGFGVVFGLGPDFYPLRDERRVLEEILTSVSLSSARETAAELINNIIEAGTLAQPELGATFHIFMGSEDAASFLSLPLGMEQANYIALLGTHTLRCNILADVGNDMNIRAGIFKIDAPQKPLNFIQHKGLELELDEQALMDKLRSPQALSPADFSPQELLFVKVLFNEYVELAGFLLSSGRIPPDLRLLIIFPRINIFRLMHAENDAIPEHEPGTLGELAALAGCRFVISQPAVARKPQRRHVPEKLIQRHVLLTTQAFARSIIKNVYRPVADIRRGCISMAQNGFADAQVPGSLRRRLESISAYLKRLQAIEQVAVDPAGRTLDLEASSRPREKQPGRGEALAEIIGDIQLAELEQVKDVVAAKMIEYLSFVSVRLEQIERISSPGIKAEIARDIESASLTILNQARAFYKLMTGRSHR